MSESRKLFDQFPPVSTREWLNKIETDLKGAEFDKFMVWRGIEGFAINPFYRNEDIETLPFIDSLPGEYPYLRSTGKISNSWYIRESVIVEDIEQANKKALSLLNRGVNSLCFIFNAEQKYNGDIIEKLLSGIFLEAVELNFAPQGSAIELLKSLREALKLRGTKPAILKGAIEADPIGKLMVNGKLCVSIKEGLDYLGMLIKESSDLPNLRVIRVDGSGFRSAGSTAVQELAMTLSMGNEYMSQLTYRGIAPEKAAESLCFTFGIGSSYFIEIAKLRAARMLWSTLVKKYKPASEDALKMVIHSVTGQWNKTLYDPYVNMLRTQTEAMSAALGGTDSLTVLPFDISFASPGEISKRIARNQQLLLKEESYFDKVSDPAAGSYYIENLTASIAEHAWKLFIDLEEEGGFLEALKRGSIQSRLNETRIKRLGEVARGKEKLLGTNIFPNFKENPVDSSMENAKKISIDDYEVEPITIGRAAEEFEKLRRATDRHGRRPKVFLLTMGNLTMRKARAQFSTNFFAVAGYEIIEGSGSSALAEGVAEARKARADIIVLCSSDDEYEAMGIEAVKLIKGKELLVVAGAPPSTELLKENGIEYFVNTRSNILETLQMFNRLLGIKG